MKTIERTLRRASNSTGVLRRLLPNVLNPDDLTKSIENETECDVTQEVILQQQIIDLQKQVNESNTELSCKSKELLGTKQVMQEKKICIDRIKNNITHFTFHHRSALVFESFDIFKVVLDYLNSSANSRLYLGSNINIKNSFTLFCKTRK